MSSMLDVSSINFYFSVLSPMTCSNFTLTCLSPSFSDEVDAFIKYLLRHQNTPAFVSRKLIQYFGVSNPTPGYSLRVTQAFKQGSYSKDGITFGDGT
jgi:hypothetical protein